MQQVSKEDFDILKKYHPGEVRYYIDLNGPICRRQKAVVQRSQRKGNKVNRRVQLTTKSHIWMHKNCLEQRSYDAIRQILDNDPTLIIGRNDLANQVKRKATMGKLQATQTIGELLEKGLLRYVDDHSTQ